MKKIITIIGARPQFIKASMLSREINGHNDFTEKIIHTGQHFDKNMSEIFFNEMQIPKPAYNLNIHSLTHGAMTGRMLEQIESILLTEKPDYVVVYGDTNSTLAGALAAKKLQIPIAHIEAGLRSFNNRMPEETNRIITDRVSDFLFCPTSTAIQNLEKEGFSDMGKKIVQSGDIMYDAALHFLSFSRKKSRITEHVGSKNEKFILATVHREENTNPVHLIEIFSALIEISDERKVVMPLHPRTLNLLGDHKREIDRNRNFIIIKPVGYLDMLNLINHCEMVMTDSGGLQKEAYFLKKPCVTLRNETEWTELLDHEVNFLAGNTRESILRTYRKALMTQIDFPVNIYGKGDAASKIIASLY